MASAAAAAKVALDMLFVVCCVLCHGMVVYGCGADENYCVSVEISREWIFLLKSPKK